MNKTFTQSVFALIALCCLIALPLQVQAKTAKNKIEKVAQPVEKEKVILLPLVISAEAQNMSSEMQAAVVQGLQQKYLVYSGDRVLQELKKASEKQNHSAKHECDETRCLQDIATAFQTENVAVVHINKIEGGYLLSVSIKGVISNEAVFDNSLPCEGCNAFKVVEKLKELSGAITSTASVSAEETVQTKVNQNDPDAVLWAEAQKGNTVDDYQVYLDTYPKGKFAPFANARIKKLKEAAQAILEQQEQQAWDAAQNEASEDSYSLYLKGYPAGRFARLAKVRLDKIKNDVALREETEFWKKADSNNDKAVIESYLNRYPAGQFIAAASAKLKAIKEEEAKLPVRPNVPFALSESIWQVIEHSDAYRNQVKPRASKVTYVGVSNTMKDGQQFGATNKLESVTVQTPLDSRYSTIDNNITYDSTKYETQSYHLGVIPIGTTMNGKNLPIKSIDEIKGSLFPMHIGAEMVVNYQSSLVADSPQLDAIISQTYKVLSQLSASELHSKLSGNAWKVHVTGSRVFPNQNNKTYPVDYDDFYLEELGIFLSQIGQLDRDKKAFVLPHPSQEITSNQYEVSNAKYRTLTKFSSYDWEVGH